MEVPKSPFWLNSSFHLNGNFLVQNASASKKFSKMAFRCLWILTTISMILTNEFRHLCERHSISDHSEPYEFLLPWNTCDVSSFATEFRKTNGIDTVSNLVFWSRVVNKLEPWHIVNIMQQ